MNIALLTNAALFLLGLGAVILSGVFMYLHNGKIWEALALSSAVACGLLYMFILHRK